LKYTAQSAVFTSDLSPWQSVSVGNGQHNAYKLPVARKTTLFQNKNILCFKTSLIVILMHIG